LVLTAVLSSPLTVNAIEVGGKQWGTWTRDNSPYNVIAEVQVPAGSTLVIEPGVVVNFKGHYKFVVDSLAVLLAVGTESDSIYFTAEDSSTGWHGVRLLYADSNSQIAFSRLERGKATGESPDDLGGAVFCYYSGPTIRNSVINSNSSNCNGGGICCYYSSVTISGNTISDNSATDHGGGIYCFNCTPITITNSVIEENIAGRGGGIQCNVCDDVSITNNLVSVNRSTWSGAGIRLQRVPTGTIKNNTIRGNCGSQPNGSEGSGIYLKYCNLLIMNNIINGNSSEHFGGGIYCTYSNPLIMNNVITANSAVNGGGLALCCNSHPNVVNNILWNDTAGSGPEIYLRAAFSCTCTLTVAYCDVEGGESGVFIDPGCVLNWGEGNIDLDPLFRDADALDLHLMAEYCGDPDNSPCIDAGHPDSLDSQLDCGHGLGTDRADMGAYGGESSGWPTGAEEDQAGILSIPRGFLLHQNCPNPFNASTAIYYQVPVHGHVTLEVYNLLGQKVTTLLDGKQWAGCGSVLWDGSGVSSGVYFYRLTAEGLSETRRMLLLK
jgi:predicted outer membrane repeat protein